MYAQVACGAFRRGRRCYAIASQHRHAVPEGSWRPYRLRRGAQSAWPWPRAQRFMPSCRKLRASAFHVSCCTPQRTTPPLALSSSAKEANSSRSPSWTSLVSSCAGTGSTFHGKPDLSIERTSNSQLCSQSATAHVKGQVPLVSHETAVLTEKQAHAAADALARTDELFATRSWMQRRLQVLSSTEAKR